MNTVEMIKSFYRGLKLKNEKDSRIYEDREINIAHIKVHQICVAFKNALSLVTRTKRNTDSV